VSEVLGEFDCPRQPEGEHLCLADYVAPHDSGRMDVVALQVVTVGTRASEVCEELNRQGLYSEAYYLHGLSVEAAEGLAEVAHQHIRQEWGIGATQGKRYSWGYPAIPDLGDHSLVWRALPVEESIGVSLTESFQLVPEQSTAAIVLHHPACRYFVVRGAAGAVSVY
jgi:5-methyltetrahydrofolate--homocysteine methyltransferase